MKTCMAMAGVTALFCACGGDDAAFEVQGEEAGEDALEAGDTTFLWQASLHMEDELAASRLARRQSRQPQVLQFSEGVRADRQQARVELEALARPRRVALATR